MSYTITIDDKLGMDASVKELKWTTTPPTVPGWYWVQVNHHKLFIVNVGNIFDEPVLEWHVDGYEWEPDFEARDITYWLGPLPEPEPPQKGTE